MGKPHRLHSDAPRPKKIGGRIDKRRVTKPSKAAHNNSPGNKKPHKQQHQNQQPIIPFTKKDRLLLIGEGDLSFAASLIKHHKCRNVVATVFEKDSEELLSKYPQAARSIAILNNELHKVEQSSSLSSDQKHGSGELVDGEEAGPEEANDASDPEDYSDEEDDMSTDSEHSHTTSQKRKQTKPKLVYNVDATKLTPSLSRPPFDHIIFNFPHVGGKSTDVNRQVRHNQQLLVSFFQRITSAGPSSSSPLAPGGSIIITLFEGEPYTLWNVRDLGRHCGLQMERSFRFQADMYPGYHHARTLGVVRSKDGAVGGGWKGESRLARSYVFRRKDEVKADPPSKKKRKDDSGSSGDEDD